MYSSNVKHFSIPWGQNLNARKEEFRHLRSDLSIGYVINYATSPNIRRPPGLFFDPEDGGDMFHRNVG
jgi:hypothetical protein